MSGSGVGVAIIDSLVDTSSPLWSGKVEMAYRAINKFGASVNIVKKMSGAYDATNDDMLTANVAYPTKALFTSLKGNNYAGVEPKRDGARVIIAAKGLPTDLNKDNIEIECGSQLFRPTSMNAIAPGGVPILFIAEV